MRASDFAQLVPASCCEVLDSMYFTTVLESSARETLPEDFVLDANDFAFSLHFAGDVSGDFGLHLGSATARSLAANFLGEDESALTSAEIGEVAGELANMLCGSVVSRVKGSKKFVLSHPQPLTSLPSLDGEDAIVFKLETDSGTLTAWIVVERNA